MRTGLRPRSWYPAAGGPREDVHGGSLDRVATSTSARPRPRASLPGSGLASSRGSTATTGTGAGGRGEGRSRYAKAMASRRWPEDDARRSQRTVPPTAVGARAGRRRGHRVRGGDGGASRAGRHAAARAPRAAPTPARSGLPGAGPWPGPRSSSRIWGTSGARSRTRGIGPLDDRLGDGGERSGRRRVAGPRATRRGRRPPNRRRCARRLAAQDVLGRHVGQACPRDAHGPERSSSPLGSSPESEPRSRLLARPKSSTFRCPSEHQHEVRRLQVAVDDAPGVGLARADRAGRRCRPRLPGPGDRRRSDAGQALAGQRTP